ncbi:MAG: hypothetical protein V4691_04900 [Pseudomonadota bacterium]
MPQIIETETEAKQAVNKPWTFRVLLISTAAIAVIFAMLWVLYF